MSNLPELLNKILNNNKLIINITSRGSYSLGYTLILNNKKIFLKLIFINNNKDDDKVLYNLDKEVYNVPHNYFTNEVLIQKYVYKKTKLSPILIDYCILDYEKNIDNEKEDIIYFINKISEKDKKKFINYNILLNNLKTNKNNKLGLIFMSYMDYINGNNYFDSYFTYNTNFGKYFIVKDLIEEIKEEEIKTRYLFIIIQIVHNIINLFKIDIIHADLHMGNIMINNNEITTNQAYFKNGNINYIYVGKVYIIDYGNVYSKEKIEKYKIKYLFEKKKKDENFNDFILAENKHIIELIGKKIVKSGLDSNNNFESGWHIYDWLLNLLFDSNFDINDEIFEHFNNLLINYEKGKYEFLNQNNEENCCWLYSLFV